MKRLLLSLSTLLVLVATAGATVVERSYSYFTIGGSTLAEIEEELNQIGRAHV